MHPSKGRTFCDSPCFFLMGALVGFLVANVAVVPRLFCSDGGVRQFHDLVKTETPGGRLKFSTNQNLAFVGIMTSKEFMTTRAPAVNTTWAKNFPGKVVFFTSEDPGRGVIEYPRGMSIVALKGVDDMYPPQKKALLMLKYMYERYLDDYRFFLRVDDDAYIKGDELVKLLHSVATDHLVIGSPGWGQAQDVAILGLRKDENYCQGGPGMIVPREVLRRTGPDINSCFKDLFSIHEDVELGRCFNRLANASCTLAYEAPFYQNYRDYKGCFNHSLDDDGIAEAITLHPLKVPPYTQRMYQHFLTLKSKTFYSRLQNLSRDVRAMNDRLLAKSRAVFFDTFETYSCSGLRNRSTGDKTCAWVFVSDDRYSPFGSDPKIRKPQDERLAENATLRQIFAVMSNPRQVGTKVKTKDAELLYSRLDQLHGFDYIFKQPLNTWNKRFGAAIDTMNFYAHRPFLTTEITEEGKLAVSSENDNEIRVSDVDEIRVNIIVTLVGRYPEFLRFAKIFEERILKTKQNISLSVVVFRDPRNDTSATVISDIEVLARKYRDTPLSTVLVEGGFSREKALGTGIQRFEDDDLLFLADVDTDFDSSTLQRIRMNTKLGERVYMPISFNEFDPNSLPEPDGSARKKRSVRDFDTEAGYWNRYGFQTVSCYKLDFLRIGDLKVDAKERGWGDSDLAEKFLVSDISVFRSADVGLKQRFNPAPCKTSINNTQQCLNTISSIEAMAEYVYRTPAIFNRGRSTR